MDVDFSGIAFAIGPADARGTRLVEVYRGADVIRDRLRTDDLKEFDGFAKRAVKYLSLGCDHDAFAKAFYATVIAKAEEADARAEAEAAERLAQTLSAERPPGAGRPVEIPQVEPWETPVTLSAVLDEAASYVRRYVFCRPEQADAVALYLAFTYAFRHFDTSPYIAITSPTKRCGKTTLIRIMSFAACRPLSSVNISEAATFRAVDAFLPTLIIDEADLFLASHPELCGVLNSGWSRDTSFVLRVNPDTGELVAFNTFGPKVIAAIGRLRDTIEDRSIIISLDRKPKEAKTERVRKRAKREGQDIARKLLRWAMDSQDLIADHAEGEPDLPPSLSDRAADNWTPLTIIADLAGGGWPNRVRVAAAILSGARDTDEEQDLRVRLLCDAYAVAQDCGEIKVSELHSRLLEIETAPWGEFYKGRPLSLNRMAQILKAFGVKSVRRNDGCYIAKSDLESAHARYSEIQRFTRFTSDVSHCKSSTYIGEPLKSDNEVSQQRFTNLSIEMTSTYDNREPCEPSKPENDDEFEEFTV